MKIVLLNFLVSFTLICNILGQPSKKITRYFAYSCQQFEYDLNKSSSGIYTLRIVNLDPNLTLNDYSNMQIDTLKYYKDLIQRDSMYSNSKVNSLLDYVDSILFNIRESRRWLDSLKNHKDSESDSIVLLKKLLDKLFILHGNNSKPVEIPFNNLEQDVFTGLFERLTVQAGSQYNLNNCSQVGDLKKIALAQFISSKAAMDLEDDNPVTARIKLLNQEIKFKFFFHQNVDSMAYDKYKIKLIAKDANIEFEDGTIKNIVVNAELFDEKGKSVHPHIFTFRNRVPISISNRSDKDRLDNIYLLNFDIIPFIKSLKINDEQRHSFYRKKLDTPFSQILNNRKKQDTLKIRRVIITLADVIKIEDILESDKEDYSPVNGTASVSLDKPVAELRKEKRSKILDLRGYTDFEGLKENTPNGIIQVEGSKKINIWTYRIGGRMMYWGFNTYIEPKLRISKIEGQNSELLIQPGHLAGNTLNSDSSIQFMGLTKYQKNSIELNGNLIKVYIPSVKGNIQFNYLLGTYNTTVRDLNALSRIQSITEYAQTSSNQTDLVTSFRRGFKVLLEFKPDPRFAFSVAFESTKNSLLTDEVSTKPNAKSWINNYLLQGFIRTNADNSFFFRYRLTNYRNDLKTGFNQTQLGYKMDIFSGKK